MMARGGSFDCARPSGLGSAQDERRPATTAFALTEASVTAWLDKARRGEELIYARGPSFPKGQGVAKMREAFDRGRVTFKQRRNGPEDYSYIAERLDEATRPAPPQRVARPVHDDDNDDRALLMAVLRRRAARNLPMGTNRELGEEIGVGPDRVAYLLRCQISAGKIMVEALGIGCRVATIVATGKRTAPL